MGGHISFIGQTLFNHDVHEGTSECSIGARLEHKMHVSLVCCFCSIGINDHKLGIVFTPGLSDVVHNVHLSADRITTPHNHQIAFVH